MRGVEVDEGCGSGCGVWWWMKGVVAGEGWGCTLAAE